MGGIYNFDFWMRATLISTVTGDGHERYSVFTIIILHQATTGDKLDEYLHSCLPAFHLMSTVHRPLSTVHFNSSGVYVGT